MPAEPLQVSRTVQAVDVPIDLIDFNVKNPNSMDERTFQAELDSILTYGFLDPCLVRPWDIADIGEDAARAGRYQMIDGEHRIRVFQKLKDVGLPPGAHPDLAELLQRWVIPCTVRPMSRAWGEKLMLIFIKTRGEGDTVRVGELLSGLAEQMAIEDLIKGLPYDAAQVEELIKVGQFDWDQYQADQDQRQLDRDREREADAGSGFKLLLTGPDDLLDEVKASLKKLKKEGGKDWSGLKWAEKT